MVARRIDQTRLYGRIAHDEVNNSSSNRVQMHAPRTQDPGEEMSGQHRTALQVDPHSHLQNSLSRNFVYESDFYDL